MRYEIVLAPEAVDDLHRLDARKRKELKDRMETHLRHEPTRVSKSRIKRLRGLAQPQFRLRVGDVRVFYDVTTDQVEVLAIVAKIDAQRWLEERGVRHEEGSAG